LTRSTTSTSGRMLPRKRERRAIRAHRRQPLRGAR
jgi:hypothetical protein